MLHLVNDVVVNLVVCHGRDLTCGLWSQVYLLGMDNFADEIKTKSTQTCVILVIPLLLEIHDRTGWCLVKFSHINILGISPPEE